MTFLFQAWKGFHSHALLAVVEDIAVGMRCFHSHAPSAVVENIAVGMRCFPSHSHALSAVVEDIVANKIVMKMMYSYN